MQEITKYDLQALKRELREEFRDEIKKSIEDARRSARLKAWTWVLGTICVIEIIMMWAIFIRLMLEP